MARDAENPMETPETRLRLDTPREVWLGEPLPGVVEAFGFATAPRIAVRLAGADGNDWELLTGEVRALADAGGWGMPIRLIPRRAGRLRGATPSVAVNGVPARVIRSGGGGFAAVEGPPAAGRPSDFRGGVGGFDDALSCELDSDRAKLGEAFEWRVALTGRSASGTRGEPSVSFEPRGAIERAGTPRSELVLGWDADSDIRIWRYRLVTREPGILTLPNPTLAIGSRAGRGYRRLAAPGGSVTTPPLPPIAAARSVEGVEKPVWNVWDGIGALGAGTGLACLAWVLERRRRLESERDARGRERAARGLERVAKRVEAGLTAPGALSDRDRAWIEAGAGLDAEFGAVWERVRFSKGGVGGSEFVRAARAAARTIREGLELETEKAGTRVQGLAKGASGE